MIDVNVGFIVQSYLIYSWTNDTEFFDEIYPFSVRAVKWLIKDSTKGRLHKLYMNVADKVTKEDFSRCIQPPIPPKALIQVLSLGSY